MCIWPIQCPIGSTANFYALQESQNPSAKLWLGSEVRRCCSGETESEHSNNQANATEGRETSRFTNQLPAFLSLKWLISGRPSFTQSEHSKHNSRSLCPEWRRIVRLSPNYVPGMWLSFENAPIAILLARSGSWPIRLPTGRLTFTLICSLTDSASRENVLVNSFFRNVFQNFNLMIEALVRRKSGLPVNVFDSSN